MISNLTKDKIRNIAIIAHVDHGKTTLVDCLLRQSGAFHNNAAVVERVMDSNDLERERGITILAKNTAVNYKDIKINIVDTPGHADFGGEVERALTMVSSVLLIIDSFEGPMPQTKFVLSKALQANLQPLVVINKADRPDARPLEVLNEVIDLFFELGANDQQLEFPVIYTSAKEGWAVKDWAAEKRLSMEPLFEEIIQHVTPPECNPQGPFQMLVANLEHDSYVGKYAIGMIKQGSVKRGEQIALIRHDGSLASGKVAKLFVYNGLNKNETEEVSAGEIAAIAGLEEVNIGETLADLQAPEQLPVITVDEPTLSMTFMVNNSPFAGQEGQYVTSRKLRERLFKELDSNVSLRVEETNSPDQFKVSGRGELHLSILIENMRREGYELQVSKPQVIFKTIDGIKSEPIEYLIILTPEDAQGTIMENLGRRKGKLVNIIPAGGGDVRIDYLVPARGLIGFRSEFLTETRGRGIMNYSFHGYQPYKGEINTRYRAALVAWETGVAVAYGLFQAEERGTLFIKPGTKVYEGMIVGVNNKDRDLEINVCKRKQLTNVRASGSDDTVKLKEPRLLSLESAIEFIEDDELVEITPKNIRLRKKFLNKSERDRSHKSKNIN
ncbi:translational GTPase TypA [Candidatus Contubernalis alkaliaceticus]|uniref:translational GTPase TypA n=1 Tax=Candidatus Contubernalis alkaliaceticus TaxID=338645 RepID=UPI001F4BCFDB|nr:translational GTPase TypA [Candidatus Contubernalis alkalaceticus]UNC90650.1 translational GTPase TypA [Candidatus Contubernalis alkalaceticus]